MMSKRNLLCQIFSFMLLAIPLAYGSNQVKDEATAGPLTNTHDGLVHQDTNSDENFNVEEMGDSASAKGKKNKKKKKK